MENKTKICFVTNTLFTIGGVQRVLAVVAKKLAEQYDVTILTLEDTPDCDRSIYELNQSDIKFIFFRFPKVSRQNDFVHKAISGIYKKFLPKNQFTSEIYARSSFPSNMRQALIQALNEGNFDVIIGVHGGLSMKLATIRKQLNARKVIGWMHNCYDAFFNNKPAYFEGLKDHFKWQMKKLNDFIVLSHADAKLFQQNLGLNPIVIYNPLTLLPGKPCNPDAKKFLTIGRMVPLHKGFDILIEAFAIFAKKNADWTLDIVGEGPEKEDLQKLIHQYKLDNRITIHPFTNYIQDYYSAASVYILSSRWEGMPLVLVEAMAHGLPIISSDIPISKELLNEQEFVHLFKSEDSNNLAKVMSRVTRNDLSHESLLSKNHSKMFFEIELWYKLMSL